MVSRCPIEKLGLARSQVLHSRDQVSQIPESQWLFTSRLPRFCREYPRRKIGPYEVIDNFPHKSTIPDLWWNLSALLSSLRLTLFACDLLNHKTTVLSPFGISEFAEMKCAELTPYGFLILWFLMPPGIDPLQGSTFQHLSYALEPMAHTPVVIGKSHFAKSQFLLQ